MDSYHGTSVPIAATLATGSVSVTLGGGELGQGFYTGSDLRDAKAWAFNRYGAMRKNVVRFSMADVHFYALDMKLLDFGTAALQRQKIRLARNTRTYMFGVDLAWAPIVGSNRARGHQVKWESIATQSLLNGPDTLTQII